MAGRSSSLRREPLQSIQLKNSSKSGDDDEHGSPIYDEYDLSDSRWGNTISDDQDMHRLGKKQEFKRNFSFLSALGFVSVYMVSCEACRCFVTNLTCSARPHGNLS